MKIAVIGNKDGCDKAVLAKARMTGKAIAAADALLMSGGCSGYPYEATLGAKESNGKTLAISPAKDEKEHVQRYGFPVEGFSEIRFTGLGIPRRNYPLVDEADAVIMIGGKTGTLNEFTLAFHSHKVIGVLKGSGEITGLIDKIAEICDRKERKESIVYDAEPEQLVKKVIERLN